MNKTKYALIIAAIILNFISAGVNLYVAIIYFMGVKLSNVYIYIGIYEVIGAIAYGITSGLLIYSILNKGRHFRARYTYYMTAVMLTLFLNLFSLPSILLIITMFISDIVWIKPVDDVYFKKEEEIKKPSEKEKEEKIAALRKLKDEGKITEEEFNDQLFKLL